jgi:hypothetical protein
VPDAPTSFGKGARRRLAAVAVPSRRKEWEAGAFCRRRRSCDGVLLGMDSPRPGDLLNLEADHALLPFKKGV